ncbi:MAG: ATP-binding cassette domain-containing protein [Acidobacteriota bacterium]|mgnify:CR=1 FL=1|jgi:ABC-type dipeptide/oligopeptide/nickel transport system ATPase subunit|nr:ATP-binding cassette domain-containing protein [Acidobacteriota bacterium]NLT33971.1 ATP-binding cassette domain-containing protein [Acidobacteriota bacterium]
MRAPSPLIEARNLRVFYRSGSIFSRPRWVAGPISLHVHRGEFVGLSGPSGCGKTSVGKALLNLMGTWEGDIYWKGRNVRHASQRELRPRFGWISQEPMLAFNPRRRIMETLRETLSVNRVTGNAQHRVAQLCEMVNLQPGMAMRFPFELSAGQIQRFALIRIFMLDPEFVLLDEPTSSLDPINQAQILDLIGEWRRHHGLTALIIAHSQRVLKKVCDRLLYLSATP